MYLHTYKEVKCPIHTDLSLVTFVANATVAMSSLAVLLEVVGHVGGTQELATHLAGDLVLMASKVRPQPIPSSKRRVTNLND